LFLVANKDTYTKVINIANICINRFKKLKDINAIIAFINVCHDSRLDRLRPSITLWVSAP